MSTTMLCAAAVLFLLSGSVSAQKCRELSYFGHVWDWITRVILGLWDCGKTKPTMPPILNDQWPPPPDQEQPPKKPTSDSAGSEEENQSKTVIIHKDPLPWQPTSDSEEVPPPDSNPKQRPQHPQSLPSFDGSADWEEGPSAAFVGEPCVTWNNQPGNCVPRFLCSVKGNIITNGSGIIDIRTKDSDCQSRHVCCSLPNQLDKPSKPTGCGYRNQDGVSISNRQAFFAEFNWALAIISEAPKKANGSKWVIPYCGGSLIHPKIALTAAHCVHSYLKDKRVPSLTVRAGEWDLRSEEEILPHQDRKISKIIEHPDFDADVLFYDAALLFLDRPYQMADNVGTVCLPEPNEQFAPHSWCVATGWGTEVPGVTHRNPYLLKTVNVRTIPNSICQKSLRKTRLSSYFILDKSFMCAGDQRDRDACTNDGGAPLVYSLEDANVRYVQIGIVSWGIGCGEDHVPGVYGNVALFRPWIDKMVIQEGYKINSYLL